MKRLFLLFSCVALGCVSYAMPANATVVSQSSSAKGIRVESKGYPVVVYLNGQKVSEPTNSFTKNDLKVGDKYQIQIYRADFDSLMLADDSFTCDSAGSYEYSFSSSPNSQSVSRKFEGGNFRGYSSSSYSSSNADSTAESESVDKPKVEATASIKSKASMSKGKKRGAVSKSSKSKTESSNVFSSKSCSDTDAMALMQKLYNTLSAKEQMKQLMNSSKGKTYNVYQVRALASTFDNDNDKMQAVMYLFDKTSDKDQYYLLRGLFVNQDNRTSFSNFLKSHNVQSDRSSFFPEDMMMW